MKFLAAITIILELPTMISGLYGMNVNGVGMPFATKAYGVCSNLDFFFDRLFDRGVYFEEETYTIRY